MLQKSLTAMSRDQESARSTLYIYHRQRRALFLSLGLFNLYSKALQMVAAIFDDPPHACGLLMDAVPLYVLIALDCNYIHKPH